MLKRLKHILVKPFRLLTCCILKSGTWPSIWKHHWIHPLLKRGVANRYRNYRGIQLTHHISKIVERIIASVMIPDIRHNQLFGFSQFAYTQDHSSRDALLLMVTTWLLDFSCGHRIGLYCSDVSGVFDNICRYVLIEKIRGSFMSNIIQVLSSWLDERRANICISGEISDSIIMPNMIYQGTVLGPILWNLFFADAQSIIRNAQSQSVVYADDMNCYRKFINAVSNETILSELRALQSDLHT